MKTAYIYTGSGSAIDDYNSPKSQLEKIVRGKQSKNERNWGFFDNENRQHRTILSQLRTLNWVIQKEGKIQVPDISRLSDFLKTDKSPVNKPLKSMSPEELSKMISCFDSMILKHYKP